MDAKIRETLTATEQKEYDEAMKLVAIIQENAKYDAANGKIDFQAEEAEKQGLDKESAQQLATYFEGLSPEEAAAANEGLAGNRSEAVITLAAAAAILAEAGLSWLVSKLLDWGARTFCKKYKRYNSITKHVCNLLGC